MDTQQQKAKLSPKYIFPLILFALSISFINTAWVAEDAFITFRAVDNLLAGHGPVWNIGERVQVYTHPLWYFLLSIGTALTGSSFYVSLLLSWLCLAGIAWIISRLIRSQMQNQWGWLAVGILVVSCAFTDYSSSGLENPLVHLLMCLYVWFWLSDRPLKQRFFATSLIYGLVYITRPDGIFLLTPASAYLLYQMFKQKQSWFKWSLLALLPVIAWETFSIIYYGTPVPNTALAKVNIDYERSVLLTQAYHYFKFNLQNDPLTSAGIILAIVSALFNRRLLTKLLAAGLAIQLLYICYVGADYMMGRFLSPAILMSVLILILNQYHMVRYDQVQAALVSALLLLTAMVQLPYTLMPNRGFENTQIDDAGIADERGFYYQELGLLPVLTKYQGIYPPLKYRNFNQQTGQTFNDTILFVCFIGQYIWGLPHELYVVDPLALSEPFLSRLPAKTKARPGHYERAFPEGFVDSKRTGQNRLANPTLKALYADVELATRGDLWSAERWTAIWRLNTGHYKNLAQYFNRNNIGTDFYPKDKIDTTSIHTCMGGFTGVTVDKEKP
ncbi:glycosyltransferase family 39 protein [Kingella denitrificans]